MVLESDQEFGRVGGFGVGQAREGGAGGDTASDFEGCGWAWGRG